MAHHEEAGEPAVGSQNDSDAELVAQAIDALRALEYRLEELAPGIADDSDDVLPSPRGRWRHEPFPRMGLALLFRMLQTGGQDLEGAASAWSLYRDTMQAGRGEQHKRYPREPLRLALWEHGCAHHWKFPPPSSSADAIADAFDELRNRQVEYFGQGRLGTLKRQEVATRYEAYERALLVANRHYALWRSDPKRYASTAGGIGLVNAAEVINADIRRWQSDPERYHSEHLATAQVINSFTPNEDGTFVSPETIRKARKHPESLWQQSKILGLSRQQQLGLRTKKGKK